MSSSSSLSVKILKNVFTRLSSLSASSSLHPNLLTRSDLRTISTTPIRSSWMDSFKGVFTGQKASPEDQDLSAESFTLLEFANKMKSAKKLGTWKQYLVGRGSDATFADAFERQEAILRCLGGFDPDGENLQASQKQEVTKLCNCTIIDVENALSKYTWAKEAQKKMVKLKEEGKPLPKNMAEVQKMMGSTPLEVARSNLAKSGNISRNALCPCGSKKRYKRCCCKD